MARDALEKLVNCIDIDGPGKIVLCVADSTRKVAQVRSLATGELLGELVGHTGSPKYGRLSADGQTAVTCSDAIKLWDMRTFQCVRIIREACYRAVFSSDGEWIFGATHNIMAWQVAIGRRYKTVRHPTRPIDGRPCISADGATLAATSDDAILSWQLVWLPQWQEA